MKRFKESLRSLFAHNVGLKLVAVSIAIVLYIIAREETIREVEIEIPLVVSGIAGDRMLMSQPPTALRVRIRGNVKKLTEILARRTPYELDLSEYQTDQTVFIVPSALENHLGEGVKALSVTPSSFNLEFDEMQNKRVPVAVNILKEPGPYWQVVREKMHTEPRFVEVRGPASLLGKIRQYHTEPLDLTNVTRDFTGKVALERRQGIKVSPTSVQLNIPISEKRGSKTIKSAKISVKGCPAGYACTASPAFFKLEIRGRQRMADQVTEENVSQYVYIDASKLPLEPEVLQKHFPAVEPTVEKLKGVTMTLQRPKYFNITLTRK